MPVCNPHNASLFFKSKMKKLSADAVTGGVL